MQLIWSSAKPAHGQLCIERAITHTEWPNLHTKSQLLPRIACIFLCSIQNIGPQRHKRFLLPSNPFLLERSVIYMSHSRKKCYCQKTRMVTLVRVQVCPHCHHICPSWRMKKTTSMFQAWLSTLPQPPALWGSVTFSIKDRVLVFNTPNYSLINGLLLQIKIQICHKPTWFAHICPYQSSTWWVDVLQWADSLLCLGTSAVREKERCQQRCHCFVLQGVSIKTSAR